MSSEETGQGRRPRGMAKSQFIEWEEDSDECMEDGGRSAAPQAAGKSGRTVASSSAASCSSPLFNSSFQMCSPVMNSAGCTQPEPSQSPVHCPQYKALPAVTRTNSKRPHRNLAMEFDSQKDMFVDSSENLPEPKRQRDEAGTSAAAAMMVSPTQMISDASQSICETQEIEEETSSSSPRAMRGSEWIRAIEERQKSRPEEDDDEAEAMIESVGSSETRAQAAPLDDEASGLSSTKKRRKKFGLAAKLESVLKQHRSDMALREHLVAAEGEAAEEELYLMVAEVVKRDAFMTELRCTSDNPDEEEVIVVLQGCHSMMSEGCEISVRGPFHRTKNYIFGVKKVELLDQNIGNTRRKRPERKILMTWDCPCDETRG